MSCCGQRRQEMRAAMQRQAPPEPEPLVRPESPIPIVYLGKGSIVVRGPVTGKTYLFASAGEPLLVDERDAPAFLRSAPFAHG